MLKGSGMEVDAVTWTSIWKPASSGHPALVGTAYGGQGGSCGLSALAKQGAVPWAAHRDSLHRAEHHHLPPQAAGGNNAVLFFFFKGKKKHNWGL